MYKHIYIFPSILLTFFLYSSSILLTGIRNVNQFRKNLNDLYVDRVRKGFPNPDPIAYRCEEGRFLMLSTGIWSTKKSSTCVKNELLDRLNLRHVYLHFEVGEGLELEIYVGRY
jgi:hypothetical protein